MTDNVNCLDCTNCVIVDDLFGIFNCAYYHKMFSGGICHNCEGFEAKEGVVDRD